MLRLTLFGFPLRVQPWFFLTAFLIGPRVADPMRIGIWIVVAFLGVVLHELGHAFAGRNYGLEPSIELHGFGGTTSWAAGRPLSPLQRVAVTAAGPGVGIAVGGVVMVVARAAAPAPGSPLAWALGDLLWVNLGWAVLNLVPILPLDGGAIVAALAERMWGRRGLAAAHSVSLALAAAAAVWALLAGRWWLAIVAGVFAALNFQAVRGRPARQAAPAVGADHRQVLDELGSAFNRRDWDGVVAAAGRLLATADSEELREHALYFLACGHLERGEHALARRAVDAMPGGMDGHPALAGSLLLEEGRPAEAVPRLEAALARAADPAVASRWVRAVVASESYDRAAELLAAGGGGRVGRDALVRLVEAAAAAGKGGVVAKPLLERRPDPEAAVPLARALLRGGEREAARSMLAVALRARAVDRDEVARDPELSLLL